MTKPADTPGRCPTSPGAPLSRTAQLASLPLSAAGPGHARLGPAPARRGSARVSADRPAPHRGAALRGPGHAQGRRDEVRPGAVGLRGGHPGGVRRPLPRGADQAAERGAADADGHRPPGDGRATRHRLADPLRRVRRRGRRRRQHRPGAPWRSGTTAARSPSRSSTRARPTRSRPTWTSCPGSARCSGLLVPGVEMRPLLAELRARVMEELDYAAEADNQRAFAKAYAGDPDIHGAQGGGQRTEGRSSSEWVDGVGLSRIIARGTRAQRDEAGRLLTELHFSAPAAGRPAARRPASGQLQVHRRRPARRGRLRIGCPAARRHAADHRPGVPAGPGRPSRRCARGLRDGGFVPDGSSRTRRR